MKKRNLLLVMFVIFGLLWGAGGMALAQQVTLEFLHTTWVPKAVEVMNGAIADFEAQYPHIKINQTTVSSGDSVNQTLITLLGGMQLDIVMSSVARGKLFKDLGVWSNLEEFAGGPEYFEQFVPAEFARAREGYFDSILTEGSTYGLFYRKDLFEAAGLDPEKPPQNWDELVEYAKILTQDTNGDGEIDQWGLGFPATGWETIKFWTPFMYQAGNPIVEQDENGRWHSTIATPSGYEATQFFADLVQKHGVAPANLVSMDSDQAAVAFAEGEFAMMFNGMWVMGTINGGYPEVYDKYGTATYPVGPTGELISFGGPSTISIPRSSRHKEEAWLFINFLQSGSPSYADRIGLACNSLSWNKSYLELDFAKDPKILPFAQGMASAQETPNFPEWDSFQALYVCPTLQNLMLGVVSVEEAVEYMDDMLNKMIELQ